MAKQLNKLNDFPIEDLNDMLLLFKQTNLNTEQQDKVWEYLKKYIEPKHPRPITGCNCSLSYGSCIVKLRDWVSLNNNKFS